MIGNWNDLLAGLTSLGHALVPQEHAVMLATIPRTFFHYAPSPTKYLYRLRAQRHDVTTYVKKASQKIATERILSKRWGSLANANYCGKSRLCRPAFKRVDVDVFEKGKDDLPEGAGKRSCAEVVFEITDTLLLLLILYLVH